MTNRKCASCQTGDARLTIGSEGPFCDSCADALIAAATGWPRLEPPPTPETFRGPDGMQHRMVYRVLRTPGGIEVLAEEDDRAVDDGYCVELLGAQDADVGSLFDQLRRMIRRAISRRYLERASHRGSVYCARSRGGSRAE